MTPSVPPPRTAIVDLRPAHLFAQDRAAGAVRFSLEDIEQRAYLLPPRSRPLLLIGDAETLRTASDLLERAERSVRVLNEDEWRAELPIETGPPSRSALWEPAALVREALQQYGAALPGKRALDVACGTGRNAVYLAQQGLTVTGVDWLPDALSRAQDLAQRSGVALHTTQQDLEKPEALAGMRGDCIVVVRYLNRALFPRLVHCLTAGGLLIYETFTIAQKKMRHPRNALFMLQPGELRDAFRELEVLFYEEDWHDGAHTAQLIARQPSPA